MSTPYFPGLLPHTQLDPLSFIEPLGKANRELARYDGIVQTLPNPNLLLAPLLTQEATLSSRIEGTQATLDEVYEQEAGVDFHTSKKEDINEVLNYRYALQYAASALEERELSLSLIRDIHAILLDGVRGETKTPGYFRNIQNWIGAKGCPMERASYIPPDPTQVDALMDNWLHYVTHDEEIDPLVQTAVMHAQFELIHPFLDGNGRIGRLMIPLLLSKKEILHKPLFYMSAYLDANRDAYCAHLDAIHRNGDWNGWIAFFLRGVAEQAKENTRRVRAMLRLYDELKEEIRQATHSEFSVMLLETLFEKPTFTKPMIVATLQSKAIDCAPATLRKLVSRIVDEGIVEILHKGAGRRADIFRASDLLHIASGLPIARFEY